jgi:flavin-dependent dehydrogenase
MSSKHPICIVGAGPGGLYAALRLAQLGMPSLVLEKATFPRPKVCGDILTSNVLRALHALDAALVPTLCQQPWAMELAATAFGSAHKAGFVMPFNSPANAALGLPSCVAARRMDFDDFLYRRAVAEPLIEIRQDCGVQAIAQGDHGGYVLQTTQGEVRASYLLLAMGAHAPLVREVMPQHKIVPRHSAVGMRMYVRGAAPHAHPQLSEFYLFDKRYMPGGLYITPFADGSVNVNAVMRLDIFHKTRPKLAELMHSYLQTHPQLRERFAQATEEAVPAGCTLFFGTTKRPLSHGNCLLIGDAAGLTDATNANGIGHAMISGGIAAERVALALAQERAPEGYDAAVYARLRNALRPGRLMKTLFANRLSAGLSVGLLHASLNRFNSKAIEELVYSSNTAGTLLNPKFYWRLFAKGG